MLRFTSCNCTFKGTAEQYNNTLDTLSRRRTSQNARIEAMKKGNANNETTVFKISSSSSTSSNSTTRCCSSHRPGTPKDMPKHFFTWIADHQLLGGYTVCISCNIPVRVYGYKIPDVSKDDWTDKNKIYVFDEKADELKEWRATLLKKCKIRVCDLCFDNLMKKLCGLNQLQLGNQKGKAKKEPGKSVLVADTQTDSDKEPLSNSPAAPKLLNKPREHEVEYAESEGVAKRRCVSYPPDTSAKGFDLSWEDVLLQAAEGNDISLEDVVPIPSSQSDSTPESTSLVSLTKFETTFQSLEASERRSPSPSLVQPQVTADSKQDRPKIQKDHCKLQHAKFVADISRISELLNEAQKYLTTVEFQSLVERICDNRFRNADATAKYIRLSIELQKSAVLMSE